MTEKNPSLLSPPDLMQEIINKPEEAIDIFETARRVLEVHNNIANLRARVAEAPDNLSARVSSANAEAKVTNYLASAVIGAVRVLATPTIARTNLSREERQEGVVYDPEDTEPIPLACYQGPYLKAHPDPLARFLTEHSDCVTRGTFRYESQIENNPEHPYYPLTPIFKELKAKNIHAHNTKITLQQDSGRLPRGARAGRFVVSPYAFKGDHQSLISNAHVIMQALFAADVACINKGVEDPNEIVHILLENAPLFLAIINTTSATLPYSIATRDKLELGLEDAGTFRRMAHVCMEGVGRMELGANNKLRLPLADLSPDGKCPLTNTNEVIPPQALQEELDAYYREVSRRRNIPLELLLGNAALGFASSFFFHYSLLLAKDTFLGQSVDIAAQNIKGKLVFLSRESIPSTPELVYG